MRTNYELRRIIKTLKREKEQLKQELVTLRLRGNLEEIFSRKNLADPIIAAQRTVEFNNDKRRRLGNVREIE